MNHMPSYSLSGIEPASPNGDLTTAQKFVADVEAFLKASRMSATAFGIEALKDPSFVRDLRNGRKPGLDIVDRVHAFIKSKSPPPVDVKQAASQEAAS
jgi:hypothetical protein